MKKLLPLLILLFALSASAKTVHLSDYTVAGDNLDDSQGLQEAVWELTGGGTVLADGEYYFTDHVDLSAQNVSITIQGDKGTVFKLNLGQNKRLFWTGNLNQLHFDGIIFLGSTQVYDAEHIAKVDYVQQFSVTNCQFYGIRAKKSLFQIGNSDARFDTVQFEGASGEDGVINALDYRGLTVNNATFLDYGSYNGTYYSKLIFLNKYWIRAEGTGEVNANSQQRLKLTNVRFDEGALAAVSVKNATYVEISGVLSNIPDGEGSTGIYLDNVEYAEIKQSKFGYTTNTRAAVTAVNNTTFEVSALKFGNGVYFAEVDSSSIFQVRNCPMC